MLIHEYNQGVHFFVVAGFRILRQTVLATYFDGAGEARV
jgi:hypothetical protein